MTAILYNAPAGVPGDVNDKDTKIEAWLLDPDLVPTNYGRPVKKLDGRVAAIEEDDAATDFYGILARSAPTAGTSLDSSFNESTPNAAMPQGVVSLPGPGYIKVICAIGTPVKGGAVYMRVVPDTGKNVGDFEADADGTDNVLLTNVTWAVSSLDSSNVTVVKVGGA